MTKLSLRAEQTGARAPFVAATLLQSGQLGTRDARALALRMIEVIDTVGPEDLDRPSTRMETLYRSPWRSAHNAS